MKRMILALIVATNVAEARIAPWTGSAKKDNPDYKIVYLINGKIQPETEAFPASLRGDEVLACEKVNAAMTKNGKGATLKKVPRKI